jgi:ABC-type multidrug transport system fused ATPase/permease subunit
MEIILLLFLLLLIVVFLYIIFKIFKWILNNKLRRIYAFTFVVVLLLSGLIHKVFFEKMEFIQSKVYPNLYLVKHPINDRDSLNKIIKNKILHEVNNPFIGNKNSNNENRIRFYEYTTAWGFSNGTRHFIENEEDPGGFSSEVLNNYQELQMAYFELKQCKNDSLKYFGNLIYFKDGLEVNNEIIIDDCKDNN